MNRDTHFIPRCFDPYHLTRNEAFYHRQSHFPPPQLIKTNTTLSALPVLPPAIEKVSVMNKLSDLSPLLLLSPAKSCKSSITNLNFTVGVSVTCASCLGFFLPHSFPFHFSHGCMPSKVGFLSEIGWKLRSPLDRSWKFVVQEVLHEH